MLSVANIRVRSFDLNYLDIYWDVTDTSEDARGYAFYVQKASAQAGPFTDISGAMVDKYRFRDTTVRGRHAHYNNFFYRIRVVNRDTAAERTFPDSGLGVSVGAQPDLAALEMARQENLRLREFSGREVLVYARRRFGTRCTVCFDPVQMRKLSSNCASCYGTGYFGGYFAPIRCYMRIDTPAETTVTNTDGSTQTQATRFFLGNYPLITEGDLVVEMENVRWLIGPGLNKVSKGRACVRQEGILSLANKGSMEYAVPVNLSVDEVGDLLASPERNYTNPHNQSAVGVRTALDDIFGPDNL